MVECWGAQGGSSFGGNGAYTKGQVSFSSYKSIYIYVGKCGLPKPPPPLNVPDCG